MNNGGACSVIITHYNSSRFLETSLRSALNQTMSPVDVVVVDDHSADDEWAAAQDCVAAFGDERVKLIRRASNGGQINAMFDGVTACAGDFVSFLDPDDFYEPDFIEVMLTAHLNPLRVAAVATCEMGRYRVGGGVLSRTYTGFRQKALAENKLDVIEQHFRKYGYSQYYNPWETGWLWSNTSGLMIRKDALRIISPNGLADRFRHSGDVYCAYGAHMVGGTVFVDQLLSWRGVHDANTAHPSVFLSGRQAALKPSFVSESDEVKDAVLHALLQNGISDYLTVQQLGEVVTTHYKRDRLGILCSESPAVADMMMRFGANLDWAKDGSGDVA